MQFLFHFDGEMSFCEMSFFIYSLHATDINF